MCGIIGYVGDKDAGEVVLSGLTALEYRGYDSAGIAAFTEGKIRIEKEKGELENLKTALKKKPIVSNIAIGHTRWATHGVPSKINAHPQLSFDEKIAIVHNGIIENFAELKKNLITKHNIEFKSDTDSEIIAHLIALHYKGNLLTAVQKAVLQLRGTFAFSVLAVEEPERLIAVRKDAPLIVGKTQNEGNFIASDIPALLKYTRDVYFIENDEIVDITKNTIDIYDEALT
ncbi:MAG: class II glutamine amidotransferase, partial [Clostridiales Family XIII bacterium]|nr:class II glutamine amidotransferase [Clostridiales Family XIII bacterium]